MNRSMTTSEMWRRYELIQAFKRDSRSVVGGINYARVIAIYLYDVSILGWVKKIAFSFFFAPRIVQTGRSGGTLVFYSYRYKGRSDYDFIVERLNGILGSAADRAEVMEKPSVLQCVRTARHLRRAWRISAGFGAAGVHRASAAALAAKYLSERRTIGRLLDGRVGLVTFNDTAPHDNLLTQLAKERGLPTVTAQHGQYRVLDSSNISPDAEAYANFISDRLLAWGPATCAEFVRFGIDSERLAVTGWLRSWDVPPAAKKATGTFGVMLNGENGAGSNPALLDAAREIADRLDLQFVVRLHPSFAEATYREIAGDRCVSTDVIPAGEYLERVDFSIAHMSGAAIEMLYAESPVYVLDDGLLADAFRHEGLTYDNVDQLTDAILDDLGAEDRGRARVRELRRWFNDDTEQDARVRTSILCWEA